jgi:2-dehydro-3-deoxyphosphooctonate aldolase (KDO 8-P synthase)
MSAGHHRHIRVDSHVTFGNDLPFVLIAGPCLMESRDHALAMAESLTRLAQDLDIPFVYKTSFDKANRTSGHAVRGLGLSAALPVFEEIRFAFGCPVLTDIHSPEQCQRVAEVVDILQVPAFLCRQTDLLVAAAGTGRVVNVKKGQFLAPWDMEHVARKISEAGNDRILLTERGVSFGYNQLVVDPTALAIMATTGYPVVIDATHAVQLPGGRGACSGGNRELAPVVARAAVAVGVAAVFAEIHENPDQAPCDGPNMIRLDQATEIIQVLKELDGIVKRHEVVGPHL